MTVRATSFDVAPSGHGRLPIRAKSTLLQTRALIIFHEQVGKKVENEKVFPLYISVHGTEREGVKVARLRAYHPHATEHERARTRRLLDLDGGTFNLSPWAFISGYDGRDRVAIVHQDLDDFFAERLHSIFPIFLFFFHHGAFYFGYTEHEALHGQTGYGCCFSLACFRVWFRRGYSHTYTYPSDFFFFWRCCSFSSVLNS